MPDPDNQISRQTTPESWRRIVEDLNNPIQRRIVADDREQTNVLVLAGPGSGKTRVLVHRIAYLIRARRENPRGILALAYNRHAAVEIRRRLAELMGDDARGVTVLTCHALAMRLTGASFSGRANRLDQDAFGKVMTEAAAILRGEGLPPDEADDQRSRLLAGFRWILVDEYQDIASDQYDLISALAGRTLADADSKLNLFAVGDDDQNIYAFNGASVEFIRRFVADYGARPAYLTDNYRSTGHIITATNAVIARQWSYLDPVRSLSEKEGIPVQMANEEFAGVWHLRETRALVTWLRQRHSPLVSSIDLYDCIAGQPSGRWTELLQEAIGEYELETGGAETSVDYFIEFLAEWSREVRRRQRGLLLLTAHRAKGLEFDHVVVLDGGWDRANRGEDADSPRRLYYVAMTRARQTLTLARFPGPFHIQHALVDHPSVLQREPISLPPPPPELHRRYVRLNLRDTFLSFAGYRGPNHQVHRAIAAQSPGDPLQVRERSPRWELMDGDGVVVGQLASSFQPPDDMRCAFATVWAIASWGRDRSEPEFQDGLRCDSWEVVVPEVVFEPAG